ncbi:hypothetical protein D3C81_2003920 [compost metagenome]
MIGIVQADTDNLARTFEWWQVNYFRRVKQTRIAQALVGGYQCALARLEQAMERARVARIVFVQATQNALLLNTQAFGSALNEM